MTPIMPFFVAFTAACAVGSTTPVNGTGKTFPKSAATELTVPQAAIIILTPFESKNEASCSAYLIMVC